MSIPQTFGVAVFPGIVGIFSTQSFLIICCARDQMKTRKLKFLPRNW